MVEMAAMPTFLNLAKFNYFDGFVLVWLIIGLWRGRKRGMSQEVLPLIEWIGIVVAGGLLYWPLYPYVKEVTLLSNLWSCILAYAVIALIVHLFYLWLKQTFGEKLVAKDPFGTWEYYLGMAAGAIRFGCMLIVVMALMNAKLVTAAERAQTEKFQAAFFSDIRFPTYGEFQQDILFNSFCGKFVETSMHPLLIATSETSSPPPPTETLAQKSNKAMDFILGKSKKK